MSRSKKNVQPWIVMLAIGLISATSLGSSMVLMGSFLPSLAGAMHASVATIFYYYTIIVLVMAAMMQVVPSALVKVNNTVIYLVVTTLVGVSLFAIGHVTSLWVFFILAALIGICVSFMNFVPVGILIDNWFNEQVA